MYKKLEKLSRKEFRRKVGVKKNTFKKMVNILEERELLDRGNKGGRPHSFVMEDRLLMTLEYLREYRTYFHIATSYGLSESSVYRNTRWIENVLIKHPDFRLPGKKKLLQSNQLNVVLTDVTESPIERPKKKQKKFYSGKKKRHTLKSQLTVDKDSKEIISTSFGNGKMHDFRLYKESNTLIHEDIKSLNDSGYQGLQKMHSNTELPKKKSKKSPLTKSDKKYNRELSSARALNENVIACIKKFKIIADRYRNRRKRFALRFNLICGIYNWELKN